MEHQLLLEDWRDAVRRLKDSTEDRFVTEDICNAALKLMEEMRFKRPDLFVQRRGEDYEAYTAMLLEHFGVPNTMPILEDEEFFELCLELRKSRLVSQKMNRFGAKDKESQAWVTKSSASSSASGARRRSSSRVSSM
jgi:hypothetical protein